MNEFKIGDRVECIKDNEFIMCKKGHTGTIIYIDNFNYCKIIMDKNNDIVLIPYSNLDYFFKQVNEYKIIFNPPATILFKDGKKYVAKCHPDDVFDEITGLQVALLKSFGIKYADLQEMLKTAEFQKKHFDMSAHQIRQMKAKAKMEEIDVKEGKSYTTSKIIVNGNELCIGADIETGTKFWCKEPSRHYVETNWINFIPKTKRGRPRKVNPEEPKLKRPVGRPRKQKLEVGDYVRIKKPRENDCLAEIYKDKLYQVTKFDCNGNAVIKDYESALAGIYSVDRLELVKKGDKYDK